MLDITGDDIAGLNDVDLRTLVGRLCEAELRRKNFPSSAVTYGGSQTAKDGGLDVRVSLPSDTTIIGFVPSASTGYQVKKPNMPRAAIIDEMKPSGTVRAAIAELAQMSGAYVIVSSAGSTSDTALNTRRKAMADAVVGIPNAASLTLDFYDRNRIATWVRDHPGLIPWVRSRIGKSIRGWRSFEAWSHAPSGIDPSYIVDRTSRIRTSSTVDEDGLPVVEGIERIRNVLSNPGRVVRLVGLSGIGKTRLAEALFDSAVGSNALEPSSAIYTNIAEDPDPQPVGMASDLIASHLRGILIVDNCAPETHRQLSEVVRMSGTTVSAITIEYDIREDQPEGTDVFTLDTSSPELVQKLVNRRFPKLSQVDAHTIAEFSGGNARVALALAGTVPKSETIAGLTDQELFRRLFHQRHDPDASLLLMAQACSLVYSFEGGKTSGEDAELPVLAELVGKSADQIFGAVAELKRRDLLQARGPWRAVLPHAIANRLATLALENISRERLLESFVTKGTERLLRSFSRRLGYLDRSTQARLIVEGWLSLDGLLGDAANLNELGRALFANIAPVAPAAILESLERTFDTADEETLTRNLHFVQLLRSLAYDAHHFERAVLLLVKFARLPRKDNSGADVVSIVVSLFHLYLSGTHAPVEVRIAVARRLLSAPDERQRELGAQALGALLKSGHFMSSYSFDFGARSRDYGYHPKKYAGVEHWYSAVLDFAAPLALSEDDVADRIRAVIATVLRGLWPHESLRGKLETLARSIGARGFWRDGWVAMRQIRTYDGERLSPESLARAAALEKFLKPKNLVEKVRGLVLGSWGGRLDLEDDLEGLAKDDYAGAAARAALVIQNLGRDVVADTGVFDALLPDIVAGNVRVIDLGYGMALAAKNPRAIWAALTAHLAKAEKPNVFLLCGFLSGLQTRNNVLVGEILEEALESPFLSRWAPNLQSSVVVDQKGIARLHRALELGKASVEQFFERAVWDLDPPEEFKRLVVAIGSKPNGIPIAMRLLSMRIHGQKEYPSAVIEAIRSILSKYRFERDRDRSGGEDYELATLVKVSLKGEEGQATALQLFRQFMSATEQHALYAFNFDNFMVALLQAYPHEILDELFSGDDVAQTRGVYLLNYHFHSSPMAVVSDDVLLAWCDVEPAIRYPLAASFGVLFKETDEGGAEEWTSLAKKLLARAPAPASVFEEICKKFQPMSWSGSLATKLETYLKLLDNLEIGSLAGPIGEAKESLGRRIVSERRLENTEDKKRSERFE